MEGKSRTMCLAYQGAEWMWMNVLMLQIEMTVYNLKMFGHKNNI